MATSDPKGPDQGLLAVILESCKWKLTKDYPLNPEDVSLLLSEVSLEWTMTEVKIPSLPEKCYIFIDRKSYPKSESGCGDLLHHFNIPNFVCTKTCTDLNGYFGSRRSRDEHGKDKSYSTWFRALIKMVREESEEPQIGKPYRWYEMGFFTRWDRSGLCRVLCVDTPEQLQSDLHAYLENQSSSLDFNDPFTMHIPLLDQVILQYDRSVWRVRDPVREIEKSRLSTGPDFGEMHEISRHAIHVTEVLSVTIETMEGIQRQQRAVHKDLATELTKDYMEQAQEYASFQLQMLKSLKLRSVSNHERLKNEITLAYNMIARQDNTVIKSIALLTMTFLPATFISAFFSTTFFSFAEDGWKSSKQLWVYWVVTIPSTLLVVILWRLWTYGPIQTFYASHSWKKFWLKEDRESRTKSGVAVV